MASDLARAGRAALLDLLADLLLHELEPPLAERLAADSVLAEALRPETSPPALAALRADYAGLFLVDLPPYSSVFLDVPPVIGGESSLRWEQTLATSGVGQLPALERAAAPDHAGLTLRALASAERSGCVADLLPFALAWLPQWLTALRQDGGDGFYGRVAWLALLALSEMAAAADRSGEVGATRPPPAPEEHDLRTLSRWLCTPAWSGWYLTQRRLRGLARRFGGSLGIAERATLLQHVFEASGLDGRTSELLTEMRAELARWQTAHRGWREALGDWGALLEPWAAELAATDVLLTQMEATLSHRTLES